MRQEIAAGTVVGSDDVEARGRGIKCAGSKRLAGLALGMALVGAGAGCHKTPAQDPAAAQVDQNAGDPANANMAPVSGAGGTATGYAAPAQPARVLGQNAQYQPQQQGEDYGQQPAAPIERRAPSGQDYSTQGSPDSDAQNGDPNYDNGQYDVQAAQDAYAADLTDAEATDPPPPLPDYEQPPAPEPDYLWTPGYWAWAGGGYYWVPGCWVAAPYAGALWTPGYWGYVGERYRFHHGFWGLHIGFYGGVNYGYGYVGHGYYGGYWDRGHFRYNTAVNRVNVNVIRNVYVHNVVINNVTVNNRIVNRVSYSGGRGGLNARPMAAEIAVLHEQRNAPMAAQIQVQREAAQNRGQFYNQNHGRPAMPVNARPVVADHMPTAVLPRVVVPMGRAAGPANVPGNQVRPGNQMQGGVHGVQAGQPQSNFRPGQAQTQERGLQPENRTAPSQPIAQPQQQLQRQPQPQPQQGWQQRQQQGIAPVQAGQPQSNFRPGQAQTQERGLQPENRAAPSQPIAQPQQQPQTPHPGQPQQGWQQRQQQNIAPVQGGQPQSNFRPEPQQQQRGLQPENRPVAPQPEVRQEQREFRQNPVQPVAPVQPRPQEQVRPQQQVAPQPRPQHMDAQPPRPQPPVHAEAPHPQPQQQAQPQPHRDDREHH